MACDIRDDFADFGRQSLAPGEATARILGEYEEAVNDPEVGPVVWLALAATQWRLGRLVDSVRDKALEVVDSDRDMGRRLSEIPEHATRRRQALRKLRIQLESEPPPPRRIRARYVQQTDFQPGDIIQYQLLSGSHISPGRGHPLGQRGRCA